MNEQVANTKHRVRRLFSNAHLHKRAVLFRNNAMQRQRQRYPLIAFNTAVIMRVKLRDALLLEQGILLHVKARRVDVRAQNGKTLLKWRGADMRKNDCLVFGGRIHLVARLQAAPQANVVVQIHVTSRLRI